MKESKYVSNLELTLTWIQTALFVLIATIGMITTARGEEVDTELLYDNGFSCTTDLDCECKNVPYEVPNNSAKCIDYRNDKS